MITGNLHEILIFLSASVYLSFSLKHTHQEVQNIFFFFQLFWLRATCFNDELILWVQSTALPAREVMPFARVRSGPRSNLRLITAGEAKSRNGTQVLPAVLNYFSTSRFPSHSFIVFLLVSAASLIFRSCLLLSSHCNILYSPRLPSHVFLDLCFLLSLLLLLRLLRGPCKVHLFWRLVLLSLLIILERPIYQ